MNNNSDKTRINLLFFQQSSNSIKRSYRWICRRGQDFDLPDPTLLVCGHEIRKGPTDIDSNSNRIRRNHFLSVFIRISHTSCCVRDPTRHVRLSPTLNIVPVHPKTPIEDRKSTRLNSSHVRISYAVF